MVEFMAELRKEITIGVVGGSDLPKQKEQLGETGACVVRHIIARLHISDFCSTKRIGCPGTDVYFLRRFPTR